MSKDFKELLIVAATHKEIKPIIGNRKDVFFELNPLIDVLVTGVGVMPTTYHLTDVLCRKRYSLVLNVGVAGSFTKNLAIGDLVEVVSDTLVSAGKIVQKKFVSMFDAGFWGENEYPFLSSILKNDKHFKDLPSVKAVTTSIIGLEKYPSFDYTAEIETMEGAAFFYTCMKKKYNCAAIRAISNFVNDDEWDMEKAVQNLCSYVSNKFLK